MTLLHRISRISSAAVLAVAAITCFAADNSTQAWNGTWKLNESKSKLAGATDKISATPDGKWVVETSGVTLNFACDGKGYPIYGGRTLICEKKSDTEVVTVAKAGDTELGRATRTLSDGGRTLTVVRSGKNADGSSFDETEVFKKVSAGPGWSGSWRSTKVQVGSVGVAVVERTGDMIKFSYPSSKSSLTAKLDGTPAREQGPHPDGVDVSMKAAGPRTIHEVDSLNGKVLEHDTLTVSADGKTMTIEALHTGDEAKQVYVYDKQ